MRYNLPYIIIASGRCVLREEANLSFGVGVKVIASCVVVNFLSIPRELTMPLRELDAHHTSL